jgi:acetoin utilization deacetylase AcuC-like enzyme
MYIKERLEEEGMFKNIINPRLAKKEELALVHTKDHIDLIENFGEGYMDADTYHREETFEIASLAVGGSILGAQHLYEKKEPILSLARPPGHHSAQDYYGGFCYFNNIAISAEWLLKNTKAKKVGIVDMDVHHGNGTSDVFRYRDDVLYISTHQWGIFPGTGRAQDFGNKKGQGYNVNIPLRGYMGNKTYEEALNTIIDPILEQFKPDVILVSYGLDGHQADPLGGLDLTTDYIAGLMKKLYKISETQCEGRFGMYLEGGYNLSAIAETVAATVAELNNQDLKLPLEYIEPQEEEAQTEYINEIRKLHEKHWKL